MLSFEKLAEKLNGKVWVKGDLKRIYLNDAGYNTKKMSTKAFIFQTEEGEYKVSVCVECPSQPWQWCKSQEDKVRESIEERIREITAKTVYVIVNSKGLPLDESNNPISFSETHRYEVFYSKIEADESWEELPSTIDAIVKEFSKEEFDLLTDEQ